ncbi:MAG: GDSL-type esterase/lipase family protein [Burkholderiales bacterium]
MRSMTALLLMGAGLWVTSALSAAPASDLNMAGKPMRIVLIGASIGQQWNLPELPKRLRLSGYEFEALQAWQFDKSEKLDETLMRPARKFHLTRSYFRGFFQDAPRPADVVILKECSTYFPDDLRLERKRELMEQWVQQVRDKHIKIMIATVVPVTKHRAALDPGKQESVRKYNDWVRDYTRTNGIVLLDLEAALRADDRERYLRDDMTSGDGSHLNRKAYDILDGVMAQALCRLGPGDACPEVRASAK